VTWCCVVDVAVSDVAKECGVFAVAIKQFELHYDSSQRRQLPAQRHGIPWENSKHRIIKSLLQESSSEQEGGIAAGKYHKRVPELCGSK
jgi:primase-polymerase (primpol)-like protein